MWQLNDCWPVASWASIDYYGRWKALHYYEKRFFAPIMISCQEESVLTQNADPNAEPYELKKSIRLCVANETMSAIEGDEIVVTADAFARSVEIRNKNDDLILSDNFFDMNAGEKRVKVISGVADELEVRSVFNIR